MLARVERMTPRRCFMLSLTLPPLGMWPAVVSGQPLVRPHRISILSGGTAQGTANWTLSMRRCAQSGTRRAAMWFTTVAARTDATDLELFFDVFAKNWVS